MITEDLFYRKFLSPEFLLQDNEAQLQPVKIKNFFQIQDQFFDYEKNKWMPLTEQTKLDGYPVEFVENVYNSYQYLNKANEEKFYIDYINVIDDRDAKEVASYLKYRNFYKRYKFNKKNFYDSRNIEKDYVKAKITCDTDNLTLKISFYKFLRDEKVFVDYETQVPEITENILLFDMKKGIVKIEALHPVCDLDFEEEDLDEKYFYKLQKKLPQEVIKKAFEHFLELVENFTGVSFDSYRKKLEENKIELFDFYKITMIPFCPELFPILQTRELKSRHVIFNFKRSDSRVFKKFCRRYKIKNTKTVRKCFMEDPTVLLTFLRLRDAGFRDMNLYNRVITNKEISSLIKSVNPKDLAFFCKFSIKKRGQKATMNTLLKNHEDYYTYYDALKMFCKYFKHLSDVLKKDILEDGFTDFNHNALSTLAFRYENKNITFSYTPEEKKLEDNIQGYDFCLPENSYELCEIGNVLHNCVASYSESVKEKSCTIVYAKKDGEYKICIELRGKEIFQERVDHNKAPDALEKEILDIWHQRHGLLK